MVGATTSNRSLRPDVGMGEEEARGLRAGDGVRYRRTRREGRVERVEGSGSALRREGAGVAVLVRFDAAGGVPERPPESLWLYPYELEMSEATA
jgi:hypothetical protein